MSSSPLQTLHYTVSPQMKSGSVGGFASMMVVFTDTDGADLHPCKAVLRTQMDEQDIEVEHRWQLHPQDVSRGHHMFISDLNSTPTWQQFAHAGQTPECMQGPYPYHIDVHFPHIINVFIIIKDSNITNNNMR